MDRKKMKLYIILLVLLLGGALLLPFGINYIADTVAGGILSLSEQESETEIMTDTELWELESDAESETVFCDENYGDGCEPSFEETDIDTQPVTEAETVPRTETENVQDNISETSVEGEGETQKAKSEKKSDRSSVSETQPASEGKSQEELDRQDAYEQDRDQYAASFSPELVVLDGAKDCYSKCLKGRESDFLEAVSDWIFNYYGSVVHVSKIELIEPVSESDDECYFQIAVYAGDDYDIFICSYNKLYGYYGIYSSQYVD